MELLIKRASIYCPQCVNGTKNGFCFDVTFNKRVLIWSISMTNRAIFLTLQRHYCKYNSVNLIVIEHRSTFLYTFRCFCNKMINKKQIDDLNRQIVYQLPGYIISNFTYFNGFFSSDREKSSIFRRKKQKKVNRFYLITCVSRFTH